MSARLINRQAIAALKQVSRSSVLRTSPAILRNNNVLINNSRLFSTTVAKFNEKTVLSETIKTELEEELEHNDELPKDLLEESGFEVVETTGELSGYLKKQTDGETVHIFFDSTEVANLRNEQSDELDENDDLESFLSFNVVIENTKNNTAVGFEVLSRPDLGEIIINSVSPFENAKVALEESAEAENKRAMKYNGPAFDTLAVEVQEAFESFLTSRGVDNKLLELIMTYGVFKENQEYVNWLKSLNKIFK